MTEQEIFLAAIDITDPVARNAFVERACTGNAPLRQQVEALLAAHDGAGDFLATPAAKQLSGESPTQHGDQPGAHAESDDDFQTVQLKGDTTTVGLEQYFTAPTQPKSLGRLGHYEVYEVLGRGAFGTVLKAFDDKLHRMVAIKVMSPELAATSPPRKRFLREARSSAAIRHDNVVAVHAVEEQPIPYLVMEFIPGQTLQQVLEQNGPLEVADVLRISQQIAAGLAAAHAQTLVHRDIKPANILMENGLAGRVKITDFGLARAADDASLTQSGTIAGTPMFMSPEQATTGTLDHRSDLFSLGSVMYLMASGRLPFRAANTMAVLKRVVDETPRPISEIIANMPEWLCAIIAKLHAKKPEDRFATAQEVADLLGKCLADLQANRPVVLPAGMSGQWAVDGGQPEKAQPKPAVGDGGTAANSVPAMPSPGFAASSGPLAPASGERVRERGELRTRSHLWPISAAALLVTAGVVGWVILSPKTPTPNPPDVTQTGGTQPSDPEPSTINSQPAGWHGWPADAPQPAIAPFDAEQAKKHQEEWAAYLKVPVEYTNSLGMKFRLIPPGEFLMGSTEEEIVERLKLAGASDQHFQDVFRSEAPKHQVILTQPFYLGIHEVTQTAYERVIGQNPSWFAKNGPNEDSAAKVTGLNTASHPVEWVAWNDAAEFCAKLCLQEQFKPFYFRAGEKITPLDGTGYRLPTEAEWEFSCRAGTTTRFWIGDTEEDLIQAGWVGTNSDSRTHSVGELKANPFGLFDIHGNVWEWVQDGWEPTFYQQFAKQQAIDPIRLFLLDALRIVRGGDWINPSLNSSVSCREALDPSHRMNRAGFRVALPVDAVRQALKTAGPGLPKAREKQPLAFMQPGFDDWVKSVAALPAEEQVTAVAKKLVELNPGFDGQVTPQFQDGVVFGLAFLTDHVADISPVRGLKELKALACYGSESDKGQLADLSPLRGLSLHGLSVFWNEITDLQPLQGMPLGQLRLEQNRRLTDLSPLRGMPLTQLNLDGTAVSDLSPLRGMELTQISINATPVPDLSPLQGMPLEVLGLKAHFHLDLSLLQGMPLAKLQLEQTEITDLSPLGDLPLQDLALTFSPYYDTALLRSMPTLKTINEQPFAEFCQAVEDYQAAAKRPRAFETPGFDQWVQDVAALPAEEQVRAVVRKLQELNPKFDGQVNHIIENGVVVHWEMITSAITDISPVRALPGLHTLVLSAGGPGHAGLSDITPLRGLKLTNLYLTFTHVSDLRPLRDMPLDILYLFGTPVSDLTALKDMPLTSINVSYTPVSDLSVLQGKRLRFLNCQRTKVADFTLLRQLPLRDLHIDFLPAQADLLRSIKTLKTINGQPQAEFWQEVEQK